MRELDFDTYQLCLFGAQVGRNRSRIVSFAAGDKKG